MSRAGFPHAVRLPFPLNLPPPFPPFPTRKVFSLISAFHRRDPCSSSPCREALYPSPPDSIFSDRVLFFPPGGCAGWLRRRRFRRRDRAFFPAYDQSPHYVSPLGLPPFGQTPPREFYRPNGDGLTFTSCFLHRGFPSFFPPPIFLSVRKELAF